MESPFFFTITRLRLNKFMNEKWNKNEEYYFENAPIHQKLRTYAKEMHKEGYKEKYIKLFKKLSIKEQIASTSYLLKKMEKETLEYILKNEQNPQAVEELRYQIALVSNIHRNGEYYLKTESPEDHRLN